MIFSEILFIYDRLLDKYLGTDPSNRLSLIIVYLFLCFYGNFSKKKKKIEKRIVL